MIITLMMNGVSGRKMQRLNFSNMYINAPHRCFFSVAF